MRALHNLSFKMSYAGYRLVRSASTSMCRCVPHQSIQDRITSGQLFSMTVEAPYCIENTQQKEPCSRCQTFLNGLTRICLYAISICNFAQECIPGGFS